MRLKTLYLDGFGHFHQRSIGPITEPVTVFYGPNEAGKSTLLAFIRIMLFGFPTQHRRQYPPLSGGRHGGRIQFSDDNDIVYTLERFAGARGGRVTVQAHTGESPSAADIMPKLTGNATANLFRNVFAFSLEELQNEGLMNDAGVSNRIYSAGLGVSGLHEFSQNLTRSKRSLFLPTGQQQKIAESLNGLARVDAQLQTIESNAGRYRTLTARKSEIDGELQGAEAELVRLSAQRTEVQNLLHGWDDWVALSDCEAQLRDMPPDADDFPENPIARLEGLEVQIRQLREDRDEAAGQLRRAEESAVADIPGEDLLYDAAGIEAVRRARSSYDNSVRDLPERQGELRGLEADFERNLADLGHQWDEEELQAFDTSLVVRNQVDGWKERIDETAEHAQQTQFQLAQERRTLQDHQAETQEARDKLPTESPPLDAAALAERQDALRAARGRLGEYERQRQNHETLRSQLNALAVGEERPGRGVTSLNFTLIGLLALIASVLLLAGIAFGGTLGAVAWLLSAVGWLMLVGLLAAFFLFVVQRNRSPSYAPSPMAAAIRQQTGEAESAMEAARQSLLDSTAALGLAGQPDAAALDSAEARLDSARNALDGWNAANARVEDSVRREKPQEQRVESALKEHEAAAGASQEAQQEWRQWLGERGLDETLTPDTMTTFIARVETARGSLSEARRMRDRVAAIEYDIQEFREQVEPLAARHGLPPAPGDRRQPALVADEIIRRLEETQTAFSDRERAREQAEENRQLLEGRERRLQSAEEELAALLAAGGADGAEDFRRRARRHEERLELVRQQDESRRSLERLSGPGDKYQAFREALKSADTEQLDDDSARLSERMEAVEARRNDLREERGRIDAELDQLTGEEESSALRMRRSTLVEQLQEHAREWSRLTIAEALLEKTRQKFEQERQPSVIRYAEGFFSGITGQRYQRLYAPIGEQTITVIDANGASKQPAELSRGTREQLYLALRFGLIREFGEHAERLPVVVDEALVNFDPERARLAAEAFAQLSETNQVLVFTCHPSTAEMFAEAAGAEVVDISG